jgi:3-hydroxyisobutyrate dehydrogenase
MARNLHKAGFLTGVWNRTSAVAQEFARATGVTTATSPASLAAEVDAIVICVSADADVLAVVGAIAPAVRAGALVIDCSTVSAAAAREAAALLAARGAAFLDCPVSGGVEGARDATLAVMCGGDASAFERARPLLAAMGRTITHFGASGAGQAAKATNQIMCAGIIRAVAEAMAFARAQQLPLDALVETLGKGAGSRSGSSAGPRTSASSPAAHDPGQLPRRLSRASARQGPGHLPRDGGRAWRRAARRREHARRVCRAHCAGLRR